MIGLIEDLGLFFGFLDTVGVFIRMPRFDLFQIGLLDFFRAGFPINTQQFIIINKCFGGAIHF